MTLNNKKSGATEGREIYTKRWVGTENAGLGTRGTRSTEYVAHPAGRAESIVERLAGGIPIGGPPRGASGEHGCAFASRNSYMWTTPRGERRA